MPAYNSTDSKTNRISILSYACNLAVQVTAGVALCLGSLSSVLSKHTTRPKAIILSLCDYFSILNTPDPSTRVRTQPQQ